MYLEWSKRTGVGIDWSGRIGDCKWQWVCVVIGGQEGRGREKKMVEEESGGWESDLFFIFFLLINQYIVKDKIVYSIDLTSIKIFYSDIKQIDFSHSVTTL